MLQVILILQTIAPLSAVQVGQGVQPPEMAVMEQETPMVVAVVMQVHKQLPAVRLQIIEVAAAAAAAVMAAVKMVDQEELAVWEVVFWVVPVPTLLVAVVATGVIQVLQVLMVAMVPMVPM